MTIQFLKGLAAVIVGLVLSPVHAKALTNAELKIGISQEFENFNPAIKSMMATTYLFGAVGRTLNTMNTEGKWVPQLAKKIPNIADGSAKIATVNGKKTVIAVWEILDNAKWGDGTPITCADFEFSRTVGLTPTVSIPDREVYSQFEKIEWTPENPKKCTFTYDKLRWDFYKLGTFHPIPKHLEESIFKKFSSQKEGYEKNSNFTRNPTMEGLYNGPYRVAEIKLGSHITLVPNKHFYGTQPKIQKLIVKLLPNTGTMEANLRSGTIDKISVLGLSFDQALNLEKKVKAESLPYEVLFKPSEVYEHIDFNLDNPILKEVKVRRAMIHAINREELVKALFEGRQQVAIHNVTPRDPWYTADPKKVTLYPHSRREAGRLLDEAGWKLDPKDNYRYKDGKKLSLQFMTTAGNKVRETVQTFLQNQWKDVGIEIVIKNEPARVFFGETTKKRAYGGLALYAWVSSPESTPRSTLHSASIPSEKNGWSGQNQPGWANKKVDELIEKLDGEFDAKKRTELAHEILRQYTSDAPVIPLYYRSDVAVRPTGLLNMKLAGHQFSETNEIEMWDVK